MADEHGEVNRLVYSYLAFVAGNEERARGYHKTRVTIRDAAIVTAYERDGMSYRKIGELTGLSHARVATIVKKAGKQ